METRTLNRAKVQGVIDRLKAEPPRRFNMQHWFLGGRAALMRNECGTAACLCGWTLVVEEEFVPKFEESTKAAKILGISQAAASQLFCPDFMMNGIDYVFSVPSLFPIEAGIRVMEILLETGEVSWQRAITETNLAKHHDADLIARAKSAQATLANVGIDLQEHVTTLPLAPHQRIKA